MESELAIITSDLRAPIPPRSWNYLRRKNKNAWLLIRNLGQGRNVGVVNVEFLIIFTLKLTSKSTPLDKRVLRKIKSIWHHSWSSDKNGVRRTRYTKKIFNLPRSLWALQGGFLSVDCLPSSEMVSFSVHLALHHLPLADYSGFFLSVPPLDLERLNFLVSPPVYHWKPLVSLPLCCRNFYSQFKSNLYQNGALIEVKFEDDDLINAMWKVILLHL